MENFKNLQEKIDKLIYEEDKELEQNCVKWKNQIEKCNI